AAASRRRRRPASRAVRGACGPGRRSVLVRVRQQREVTRSLNRGGELALVRRTRPGDAARDDLAGFRNVSLERRAILVVDLLDAFRREPAELLAAKITCHVPSPRSPARLRGLFLGRGGAALAVGAFRRSAAAALGVAPATAALVGIPASAAALVGIAAS